MTKPAAWRAPAHDPARELRDHLPATGWEVAVREVFVREGLAAEDLAPFATGSDVVWGTRDHVVKLTAPRWTDEVEAEVRLLRHVAGRLPVSTPGVVATGALAGWPYVVMERVPGRPLGDAWEDADDTTRLRLAHELGEATAALHALPLPLEPRPWAPFWAETLARRARHLARPGTPAHLLAEVPGFVERAGPLAQSPLVLTHTELLHEHVLVSDDEGPRIAALLDFADGRVAPAAYEFAAPVEFVFRGAPGALDAFLDGYGDRGPRDAARSRTMLAWALCHRYGSLRRMLAKLGGPEPAELDELARRLYRFG